jgi:exodeoxyribonuclease VII large subunit
MTATSNSDIQARQHIFHVSELTQNIKRLLEERFPFVWISGEISDLRIPSSGHCYFTLKDETAQIRSVMFRGQAAALKFRPEDGLAIIGLGRLSVYEPRGTYQIIFEYLEPKGIGALQLAFEALKRKLSAEGLFDEEHKKALPPLPRTVSVVTSPTGAAVRDFIRIAQRRFPNLPIQVVPVAVQGERAPVEITRAIEWLNRIGTADIIVLSRGGGSIEDLCAFNDETLARTIFTSRIPVVSAVGHETDFSISDFVADLRAPTPSAAAELIVPHKESLQQHVSKTKQSLYFLINNNIEIKRKHIHLLGDRIVHPNRRLQDLRLRLDDHSMRLSGSMRDLLRQSAERIEYRRNMLLHLSPRRTIATLYDRLDALRQRLSASMRQAVNQGRVHTDTQRAMLEALNPLAILKRGYSITRTTIDGTIVRRADGVDINQPLEILLGDGRLQVTVDEKQP